jgi:CheY-specific phosphatase CheX
MHADVDTNAVIKANNQFWEQMLAMSVAPLPGTDEVVITEQHLLSWVGLHGAWNGRIEVRMTSPLALTATAAMMMSPVEAVAEADTLDAAKEIANMIAGVIKSSLPRPCSMSVPESQVDPATFTDPPPAEDTLTVAFRHETGDMIVRILEQQAA